MKLHRKQRLYFIIMVVFGVSAAVSLVVYALRQNINLYYTPTQVMQGQARPNQVFRMGGMVKAGSIQRVPNTLEVNFVLTDFQSNVAIHYTGILPALFHDDQGVVVEGKLNAQAKFVASQVLAKHDEKYMPADIQKMIKNKRLHSEATS